VGFCQECRLTPFFMTYFPFSLLNNMQPIRRKKKLLLWLAFILIELLWWALGKWLGYPDFSSGGEVVHRFNSAELQNTYDLIAGILDLLILPAIPAFSLMPRLMNAPPGVRICAAGLISSLIYISGYLSFRIILKRVERKRGTPDQINCKIGARR